MKKQYLEQLKRNELLQLLEQKGVNVPKKTKKIELINLYLHAPGKNAHRNAIRTRRKKLSIPGNTNHLLTK